MHCNPHGCRPFRATNVISLRGQRWYVSSELGTRRVQLFMRSEWDFPRGTLAAWWMAYGILRLHDGKMREAAMVSFRACEERNADGWDDDGFPLDGALSDPPVPPPATRRRRRVEQVVLMNFVLDVVERAGAKGASE